MTTVSMATIHSIDRAKERAGLNERRAYKMIDLALERGKTAEDFTSWERDYLLNEGKADTFDKLQKIGCYAQNDKVISVMTNIGIIKRQKYNDIIGL